VTLRLCQQSRAVQPQVFVYFENLACNLAQRRYLFLCCTSLHTAAVKSINHRLLVQNIFA
jgi:hypothetical protein